MIKMAQLEHIRKLYYLEGLSIREISRITGHHRDTIAKYLNADSSDPPRYCYCHLIMSSDRRCNLSKS
jgi:IS30 family transposase